ncbi:MAG: SUMF1/EgtB/PvdO family nonheme iron enzyme [Verrucomicrobiales bacterium]
MPQSALRLALVLVILVPWTFAQDAPVPGSRLAALDAQFRAVIKQNIDKPHLERVAKLDVGYTVALERAMQDATRDGKLKEAVALRDEIQRMAEKVPLPETDAGVAPPLDKLRGTYREALGKLVEDRRKAAAPVMEKCSVALTSLRAELTKAGKLDEALTVEEYRTTNLAERLLGAGAVPPPAPSAPGKTTGVAASATKDQLFENHLRMRFVPVPITGGGTDGKKVLFSVWETRVKDYAKFVEDEKWDWPKPDFKQGDDYPAVNVSWEDATAFAEWLTKRERGKKRIGAKDVYRLPSDHEWSCAVGIGKDEDPVATIDEKNLGRFGYPWGKEFPPPKGAGNYYGEEMKRNPTGGSPVITGYDDGFERTAPVGSFLGNAFGLFDLSGNAYEWCEGLRVSSQSDRRIVRGGAWNYSPEVVLRSSYRDSQQFTSRGSSWGCRLVLEVESGE